MPPTKKSPTTSTDKPAPRDTIPTIRAVAPQEPDGLSVGVSRRKSARVVRDRKDSRSARPRKGTIQEVPFLVSQKIGSFQVVVTGESLWPDLVPGKRYVARRDVEPQLGDIVVATNLNDPSQAIVKRVSAINDGLYTLSGTVSWSATFTVARPQIIGVVEL